MPPLVSRNRGMTKNPVRPGRYRPGKPLVEESSSSEEEEDDVEAQREQERVHAEAQRRKQQPPKASSFPAAAAPQVQEDDSDEEGFVTDEEEAPPAPERPALPAEAQPQTTAPKPGPAVASEESEEEEEEDEEESSEEESSSEDEAPRVRVRPTFVKKSQRGNAAGQNANQAQAPLAAADSAAESEARRAQRQEKADQLVREQIEKAAIARAEGNRAWDDDELVQADEEEEIDDRDGIDPEGEYAAWKLREFKRLKREREAIEQAEKEREEVERRRNLTAEEREREDQEFIAKQKAEREANRGETGFMQRYFHKGAFYRDDLEKEGLDQRNVMGRRFVDEVATETLPQYMQVRDMTKLGKKGRTRYRDLKTEDTGRFGEGYQNKRRPNGPPIGITDERFMPDQPGDRGSGPSGPTGANASIVQSRRRSRSRSPRYDRRGYRDDRSRSRERRKRSPSPYDDREKRRRVDST
ncbi:hypothetical protein N7468_001573 [Penicillium chermesinum]|uniref:Micro-fibrillar-associated protein 1 C-terminal domain-containing protein n=1 Tax=Penicillium chermesinum TaxID=63820 RepID=A0A9W9PGW0_9EURO|nr:uncharacterized protein N7468_001573 [Penicillium chermesinum]KAJ5246590.1 hypothetical protein N7468_001573 [Penicillium chermesinum]KAJ6144860.1 hypothetical protein N7470_008755 [Penicillium chermesinum]